LFSVDFRFFLDMFTACGASEFLRKNAEDTRLCLPRSIVLFFFRIFKTTMSILKQIYGW